MTSYDILFFYAIIQSDVVFNYFWTFKGRELIIEKKWAYGKDAKHQEIYAKHWEISKDLYKHLEISRCYHLEIFKYLV